MIVYGVKTIISFFTEKFSAHFSIKITVIKIEMFWEINVYSYTR